MKAKLFLITILTAFITLTINAQYDAQNISMLGHWYNPTQVADAVVMASNTMVAGHG